MNRVAFATIGTLVSFAIGCGVEEPPPSLTPPPSMPTLNPGTATLRGRVLKAADGLPIAGATISVLDMPAGETPRTTTSSPSGAWELTVPGSTSITVRADATDFASSFPNSISVTKGMSSAELDILMVPATQIDQLSAMMGGARVAEYGVAAIEVRSLTGACDPTGGKVTIEPSEFGKVVYSKPNTATPDTTLGTIQNGARPAAWLLGVLPPGVYYQLKFVKAGCAQKAWPVDYKGRSYSGRLPIASKALSHGVLFVD
jgi:hypothetical protein